MTVPLCLQRKREASDSEGEAPGSQPSAPNTPSAEEIKKEKKKKKKDKKQKVSEEAPAEAEEEVSVWTSLELSFMLHHVI